MPRSVEYFINDMLEHGRRALAKIRQAEAEARQDDDDLKEVILYNIIILDEASTHIPAALKDEFPGISWSRIKRLRNLVAHVYLGLDWEVTLRVSRTFLPKLLTELEVMTARYPISDTTNGGKQ